MHIAYVRVSTEEQNEERQVEALKIHGIEKWFIEKVSARTTERPQLQAMLDFAREGDVIYIHDLSRLARSAKDLLELVERLEHKGILLHSNKENIDTSTATGKLMLTMVGAFAEFERQNFVKRRLFLPVASIIQQQKHCCFFAETLAQTSQIMQAKPRQESLRRVFRVSGMIHFSPPLFDFPIIVVRGQE